MVFEAALLSIILLGFIALFVFFNKKLSSKPADSNEALLKWLQSMQTSLESTNKTLNEAMNTTSTNMVKTLQENSRQLNERLDKAAAVIRDVGKEVGTMSEIGRNMRDLQEFLKSPKLRGNIGEHVLTDLIAQMFPKQAFHLQYTFKTGDKVDAAITTDAGILCIDAKFPMENFQKMNKTNDDKERLTLQKEFIKDIKRHIDAISKKYILPDEGTMDFALMYIPSESVYYEVVNLDEIMEYARRRRVFIVSPSTLYAHLQTILLSFEGKKIETRSKEVFKVLRALQIDYQKVSEGMGILGKHLNNASSQYANVTAGFTSLGQKLNTTQYLEQTTIEELPQEV